LLVLPFGWWRAQHDAKVELPPARIASSARSDDTHATKEKKRTTRPSTRPPLVIHPPSADTGEAPAEPPFEVSVYFETKSGEQLPGGYVVGCGHIRPVGLESGSRLALEDVPCSVTGIVEDGFLTRRGVPAEVEPESGDVTLTFPDERTG